MPLRLWRNVLWAPQVHRSGKTQRSYFNLLVKPQVLSRQWFWETLKHKKLSAAAKLQHYILQLTVNQACEHYPHPKEYHKSSGGTSQQWTIAGATWLVHLTFSFSSSGTALLATLMQDTSAEMFARAPLHGCPGAKKYILASPRPIQLALVPHWPNARVAWPINYWGLHWWLAVWKHLCNSNTRFNECWKDDKQVSLSCPCACGAMPFEHHRCTGQEKHRDHTSICWWSPRCSPGSDSERLSNTKSCQLLQSSNITSCSWLWTKHVSITHTQKNTTNQVEALHKSEPQQRQLGWCIWPLVLAALELHCWPRWCKTLQLRCLRVRPCMVAQALRNIFSQAHAPSIWPWSPTGPMPELLGPSTVEDCTSD